MLYRDPNCVFVASSFGHADVVRAWLGEHGIPAQVMNRETMGGFISPLLLGATGIEVWVLDPAQTAEAIRLLGDHAMALMTKEQSGGPVEVVCDECGAASVFEANFRGTVQNCPICSAYLDVEDFDWGDESEDDGDKPEDDGGPSNDGITDEKGWGLTKP